MIVSSPFYWPITNSIFLPIASAPTSNNFTLKPTGGDIAEINNIVTPYSVTVFKANNGTAIRAVFVPAKGTMSQAACLLGFNHFNWIQTGTSGFSYQQDGEICSQSSYFIDPPHNNCNGSNHFVPITVHNGAISYTITEPADESFLYYNEGSNYPGYWNITNKFSPDGFALTFYDSPEVYKNDTAQFWTSLVGVKDDGTYSWLKSFHWNSTYYDSGGGVIIICASQLEFTNGVSGIGTVQTNLNPADFPSDTIALINQNAGSFPASIQPATQTVTCGGSAIFSIFPTNASSMLNYQWRKNGNNISGSTNLTLQLLNVTTNDAANYDAILSNSNGSVGSTTASLSVVPLIITTQPTNLISFPASNVTFSVAVSGVGPFTYQWQLNGTNLPIAQNNIIKPTIITTVAGNGIVSYSGDGGAATNASLYYPEGVAVDTSNNVYIADTYNYRIRKVGTNGIITTVAGNGSTSYPANGGIATNGGVYSYGVMVNSSGGFYISDYQNSVVRKITNGIIRTVAGNTVSGYSGDGGAATSAHLNGPIGMTIDLSSNLFIADYNNHRIRKVGANGIIKTVAGNGIAGYSGDAGMATNASLNYPFGIAVDRFGSLFIADYKNNRIRKVDTNGIIITVAGNGTAGFSGDGGAATNASLYYPLCVAVDASNNIFIADANNNRIRKIDSKGTIVTVAGNGRSGFFGDDGEATNAIVSYPLSLSLDGNGDLFVVDNTSRIRKVFQLPFFGPQISLGNLSPNDMGYYSVIVSNSFGSVTSGVAQLSLVLPTPAILQASNGLTLNWSAVSGFAYQVQYSTNLASGNWINLGNSIIATNSTVMYSEGATNLQRFYRIKLLP